MSLLQTYKNVKPRHWLILWVFWTFMAAMVSSQLYFNSIKNGLDPSWPGLFLLQIPISYQWMLVSPFILFLVNKYPFSLKNWFKSILTYLGFGTLILFVLTNVTLIYMFSKYGYIDLANTNYQEYSPYFFSRFTNDFLIYVFIVAVIVLIRSYSLRKSSELNMALMRLKNDQLKNQLTQSQLQALKLQLNPHFLFNTLNTISSLTLVGEKNNSISVTTKLGDFLRRTLDYEDFQLVSLNKELEFFDLYLAIESSRFKDLKLEREIDQTTLSHKVPNLILQPLIENAIKYGIAKSKRAKLIELKIRESNGMIEIDLFNEGPFLPTSPTSKGTGLTNVESRLKKLYPQQYLFEMKNDGTRDGVLSTIHIPINPN
ncbi:MAG: histidine kinase [Cyclobacteriaceae bacterium]